MIAPELAATGSLGPGPGTAPSQGALDLLASLLEEALGLEAPSVAERLLDTFGSIEAVCAAGPHRLKAVPGMTRAAATLVDVTRRMLDILGTETIRSADVVANPTALERYLARSLRRTDGEKVVVILLDAANRVLGVLDVGEQPSSQVRIDVRRLLRAVLDSNAFGAIIAHNHPSGDLTPSRHDITTTQRLARLLADIGVALHDHVIVGNAGTLSMRRLGCFAWDDRDGQGAARPAILEGLAQS